VAAAGRTQNGRRAAGAFQQAKRTQKNAAGGGSRQAGGRRRQRRPNGRGSSGELQAVIQNGRHPDMAREEERAEAGRNLRRRNAVSADPGSESAKTRRRQAAERRQARQNEDPERCR